MRELSSNSPFAAEVGLPLLTQARQLDRERALLLATLPEPLRTRGAGLVLLNAELARVPEIAGEEMVALVRFQWWREAITRVAEGGMPDHPALAPLAGPLRSDSRLAGELLALVDAREAFLLAPGFDDVPAFERFARATSGRLHGLLAALDPEAGEAGELDAFTALGTAYGRTGLLRALPHYARLGISVLPETLAPRRIVLDAVRSAAPRAAVRDAVARLAAGFAPVPAARLPSHGSPAAHGRTLRALARWSQRKLAAAGFDPFRLGHGPRPGLAFRLLLAHFAARVRSLR